MKFLTHKLDFFKTPFFLRTNKNEKTSTNLGFIFSIGILIFLTIYFVNCDIFQHKRPQTSDQSLQILKKENIDLNKQNFGLIWAIIDEQGQIYRNDSIFSTRLYQTRINSYTRTFSEFYEKSTHSCNESDFENERGFTRIGFECLNNNTLNLNGGFEEETTSYFNFGLNICDNKTSNNSCQNPEIIEEFFKDKFLMINFKNSNYDLNNYKQPITLVNKELHWSISSKMRKIIYLTIKKLEINTDDGFFFKTEDLKEGYKMDTLEVDVDLSFNYNILAITFTSSPNKQFATRNYQKVQEVIAGIGGIFSFLSFLGFILTYYQNYLNRISIVMNELYSFPNFQPQKTNEIFDSPVKKKLTKIKKIKPLPEGKKNKNKKVNSSKGQISPVNDLKKQETLFNPENFRNIDERHSEISENHSISPSDIDYIEKSEQDFHSKNQSQNIIEIQSHNSEPIINDNSKINIKSNKMSGFSKMFKKKKDEKKLKHLHCEVTKQEKFKFSMVNFLTLKFKKFLKMELTKHELLFIKIEKEYLRQIDLINILNRIHEINKIKLLLFNERQISLINYLSKPMIYIKKDKIDIMKSSIRISEIIKSSHKKKDFKHFFENYQETFVAMKYSEIDKNLIKFLDEKANELIIK